MGKTVAGFGAALAGIGADAPAALADVVNLTGSFQTDLSRNGFVVLSTSGGFEHDVYMIRNAARASILFGYFGQYNGGGGAGMGGRMAASASESVSAGFGGRGTFSFFGLSSGGSGTYTFVFQSAGRNGATGGGSNVGWFRLSMTPVGATPGIAFLDGAIETVGGSIQVGESAAAVPLLATLPLAGLGVLALGAAGLRRKRKADAAA